MPSNKVLEKVEDEESSTSLIEEGEAPVGTDESSSDPKDIGFIVSDPVEGELADTSSPDGRPYKDRHFLLYGAEDSKMFDGFFDCAAAKHYLQQNGITSDNALTQARLLKHKADEYAGYRESTERYCDFCGKPLTGAEYDVLKDGRDRCVECSETVVSGKGNFESLFSQVREGLIEKYAIELPSKMTVEVVSTKKLARRVGKKFVPTKNFDARTVGLATNRKGQYGVMFENGIPRISLIATTAHELTHIWQYSHWNAEQIDGRYGKHSLAIYEGMAKWSEIQYLYLINEAEQAERTLENEIQRTDVYGFGLRLFLNEYPLSKGIVLEGDTPFNHVDAPIRGV